MLKRILKGFIVSSFLFSFALVSAKGPTGPPNIIGPKTSAPTAEEIRKIKCTNIQILSVQIIVKISHR